MSPGLLMHEHPLACMGVSPGKPHGVTGYICTITILKVFLQFGSWLPFPSQNGRHGATHGQGSTDLSDLARAESLPPVKAGRGLRPLFFADSWYIPVLHVTQRGPARRRPSDPRWVALRLFRALSIPAHGLDMQL